MSICTDVGSFIESKTTVVQTSNVGFTSEVSDYLVVHMGPGLLVSEACLLVGCLTSQQHASVSQGGICTDNFTCCHTEIEAADPTFYLTQSQYTDTGPTSPSADPITPGPGRVGTGVPIFKSLVWLDPEKIPAQAGFEPGIFHSRGWHLTTRPTRWCVKGKQKDCLVILVMIELITSKILTVWLSW